MLKTSYFSLIHICINCEMVLLNSLISVNELKYLTFEGDETLISEG